MIEQLIKNNVPFFIVISNDSLKVGEQKRMFKRNVPIASQDIKQKKYHLYGLRKDLPKVNLCKDNYRLAEKTLVHNDVSMFYEYFDMFQEVQNNQDGKVYEFMEFKQYYERK